MRLKTFNIWADSPIDQKLYNLKKGNEVIVYAAEEQVVTDNFNPKKIKKQKKLDFVFGGAPNKIYKPYQEVGKVHLWSNFWLYKTLQSLDLKNIEFPSNDKLFISLNHVNHNHRCRLMDILCKNKLLKNGIVSWYNTDGSHYKWRYWKPKRMTLDDDFSRTRLQHVLPSQYNRALINLIPESTVDSIFVTEKTWHAILAAKPFIILGDAGIHQYLEKLGFELYTEFFNYDFDNEEDLDKRIDLIVKNLSSLKKADYQTLYKKVKDKCIYNQKLACNMVKNQEGIPEIALQSKYYYTIVKDAQCKLDTLGLAN